MGRQVETSLIAAITRKGDLHNRPLQGRREHGITGTRNGKNAKKVPVPYAQAFALACNKRRNQPPHPRVEAGVRQRNPPSTIMLPGTRNVPICVDRTYLWVAPSS